MINDHMQQLKVYELKIEHIMSQYVAPFTIVVECEECGHKTVHDNARPTAVQELAKLVASEINAVQILLMSHIYSAIMIEPQCRTNIPLPQLMRAWEAFSIGLQNRQDGRGSRVVTEAEEVVK